VPATFLQGVFKLMIPDFPEEERADHPDGNTDERGATILRQDRLDIPYCSNFYPVISQLEKSFAAIGMVYVRESESIELFMESIVKLREFGEVPSF
jgi:hypothetical protein